MTTIANLCSLLMTIYDTFGPAILGIRAVGLEGLSCRIFGISGLTIRKARGMEWQVRD